MKIIPSEKIEINTSFSIEETRAALDEFIRPNYGVFYRLKNRNENKLFEGLFFEDKFKMQRIIRGNNSFLPQIKGEILTDMNGAKLTAELKVHTFIIVFMIIWFSGVTFGFIMITVGVIHGVSNPFFLLIPIIMFLFGIGLVNFGFNLEKDNSINDLKRIINGQLIEIKLK